MGCQVHVHLLNTYYKIDKQANTLFFLEFYELNGLVTSQQLVSTYAYSKQFDGLIIVFDLSNLKTLANV